MTFRLFARAAALLSAAWISSPALAGFTFSYNVSTSPVGTYTAPAGGTPSTLAPPNGKALYAIDVRVTNTGGTTGTGITALEMAGNGLPSIWTTTSAGVPNASNFANGARVADLRSYLTLQDTTGGAVPIVETFTMLSANGYSPTSSWGSAGTGTYRTGAIQQWRISGTGNVPEATDVSIARLIVAGSGQYVVTSVVKGSAGTAVTDTRALTVGTGANALPTITISPQSLTIDVSPPGFESASATITASDSDGAIVSLSRLTGVGKLADNLIETGTNPKTFNLSGLTYDDLGTYTVTYLASDDSGGSATGTLTINIVPEPVCVTGVCIGVATLRRRRR